MEHSKVIGGGLAALAAAGFLYSQSEYETPEPFEVEGVTFAMDNSFGKPPTETELGRIRKTLSENIQAIEKYGMSIPDGTTVQLSASGEYGGDVGIDIEFDTEALDNRGEFIVTSLNASSSTMHFKRGILFDGDRDNTIAHELVHMARILGGTFVTHTGFEEGLATWIDTEEHGERKGYSHFPIRYPMLYRTTFDQPFFMADAFIGATSLPSFATLEHSARAAAWDRFLSEEGRGVDFVRELQDRQEEAGQEFWTLEEVLALGNEIDPEFKQWFERQRVFKAPEKPFTKAYALEKDGVIELILIEAKKKTDSERGLHAYSYGGIDSDVVISLDLGNQILDAKVQTNSGALVNKFDLNATLKQSGFTRDQVKRVKIRFKSGKEIPYTRIN